mgnify:CR=1 FL=1
MGKISDFFYRVSRGWVTLLAVALFLVFSALELPRQSAKAEQYSQGIGSPDTSLFYSGGELYSMAKWYGADGRAAYLRARWTFDLAFPFVYTFFLVTAVSWVLNRVLPERSRLRLLNLLPLAAMLFDFLENSMTSLEMVTFPSRISAVEWLAVVATPLKWFTLAVSFLVLLIGVMFLLVRRIKPANR